jgi:hypothetical protein
MQEIIKVYGLDVHKDMIFCTINKRRQAYMY